MKKSILTLLFLAFQLLSVAQTATDGTLTVTATVTYNGVPYYYAVWLKDSQGTFVRTLTMFGLTTKYYADLSNWYSSSGASKTNATTGATKTLPGTYTSSWNGKNQTNTTTLADGNYTVSIETVTEGNFSKLLTTTFVKGTSAQTITPSNLTPLASVSIKWTPTITDLEEVELSKIFTIYPNPAISSVFVNGPGIKSLTLLSLTGKQLSKTILSNLNLSNLPNGVYLLRVETEQGTFCKKIVKTNK